MTQITAILKPELSAELRAHIQAIKLSGDKISITDWINDACEQKLAQGYVPTTKDEKKEMHALKTNLKDILKRGQGSMEIFWKNQVRHDCKITYAKFSKIMNGRAKPDEKVKQIVEDFIRISSGYD